MKVQTNYYNIIVITKTCLLVESPDVLHPPSSSSSILLRFPVLLIPPFSVVFAASHEVWVVLSLAEDGGHQDEEGDVGHPQHQHPPVQIHPMGCLICRITMSYMYTCSSYQRQPHADHAKSARLSLLR